MIGTIPMSGASKSARSCPGSRSAPLCSRRLRASATTAFLAGSAATPAAQPAAAVHGYTTAFGWSAALFAAGAVVAATLYKRGVPQVAPAAEPAAALH